jgi:Homocysteine/selenocysteine methylase (S-methylmethionine-dependent)
MLVRPDIVSSVPRDFFMSGARVICLDSFAASVSCLTRPGIGDQLGLTHLTAITLARQSLTESSVLDGSIPVAGCLGPLVASYVAEVSLDYYYSLDGYRQLVDLRRAGVALFLIVTMSYIDESRAAITAVKEADKPAFLSLTIKDDLSYQLRSGEDLRLAIEVLSNENPYGILLNCSSPETISPAMSIMTELSLPFGGLASGFTSISSLSPGSTVDKFSARKDF